MAPTARPKEPKKQPVGLGDRSVFLVLASSWVVACVACVVLALLCVVLCRWLAARVS